MLGVSPELLRTLSRYLCPRSQRLGQSCSQTQRYYCAVPASLRLTFGTGITTSRWRLKREETLTASLTSRSCTAAAEVTCGSTTASSRSWSGPSATVSASPRRKTPGLRAGSRSCSATPGSCCTARSTAARAAAKTPARSRP